MVTGQCQVPAGPCGVVANWLPVPFSSDIVALTVQSNDLPEYAGDTFVTPGYYFDPADRKIQKIRVAEVNDVHSAVVAGPRATNWLKSSPSRTLVRRDSMKNTQLVLMGGGIPITLSCSMTNRTLSAVGLAASTYSARATTASGVSYPWMRRGTGRCCSPISTPPRLCAR